MMLTKAEYAAKPITQKQINRRARARPNAMRPSSSMAIGMTVPMKTKRETSIDDPSWGIDRGVGVRRQHGTDVQHDVEPN